MNKLQLILFTLIASNCNASELRKLTLEHNHNGFTVIDGSTRTKISNHLVDKELRGRTTEQIAKFAAVHSIRLSQATDGSYNVRAHLQTKGGGAGGAYWGAWIGKAVGYGVGVGTCYVVGGVVTFIAGPIAGAATAEGIKAAALPAIEAFSNVCAVGGGILGGVATGPV